MLKIIKTVSVLVSLLGLLLSAHVTAAQTQVVKSATAPLSAGVNAAAANTVMLESPEELDFTPREALIIAGFDTGEVFSVSAAIVPPQRLAKDSSDVSRWWLAAPVRIPVGATSVTWIGQVFSPSGAVSFTVQRSRSLSEVDGVPQLRAEVAQLSTQVTTSAKELVTLEKDMSRLRSEAELIGNFGRIIDAQEELSRAQGELSQLDDQTVSVTQFLQKAQNFAVPGSPIAREQQLTREIAVIAEATQNVERHELLRRSSSEREAKRMMVALEEARSPAAQDPEFLKSLRSELARLISQREQLEVTAQ